MEHLSNIELYYTPPALVKEKELILRDEEFHHSVRVMRNTVGNPIYITDGEGTIYTSEIHKITENELTAKIIKKNEFENKAKNIWLCIPLLKNPVRLKFIFEKCTELGITNFILFSSKHTISKSLKPEKFQKTTLAAMKQSLRAFLPQIKTASLEEIIQFKGTKILFDQNTKVAFDGRTKYNEPAYFLFGPEGGFDNDEIEAVDLGYRFNLSSNRLRSETAIIKCASILNLP